MNGGSLLEEGEEIVFLEIDHVFHAHTIALTYHPENLRGVKSTAALEGAIGRAINCHLYEGERDLVNLASYYWHGLGTAHGFNDANKRTAFICAEAFLKMNGMVFDKSVAPDSPGHFTDACFEEDRFDLPTLTHYLRTASVWIDPDGE